MPLSYMLKFSVPGANTFYAITMSMRLVYLILLLFFIILRRCMILASRNGAYYIVAAL